MPMLQAEEDRDMVRRYLADQAREKELLGQTTSPYHSDRYVRHALFRDSLGGRRLETSHKIGGTAMILFRGVFKMINGIRGRILRNL